MRVKTTAKKITGENANDIPNPEDTIEVESSDHNSCDNQNDISDNEVEFLIESRRDQEGNQFLLDGTPLIEPAPVDESKESKENESMTKEINFNDFLKEIQVTMPDGNTKASNAIIAPKRNVSSYGPNINTYSSVKCTACTAKYNPFIGQTLYKHPLMEVLLCSNCIENQKDKFFVIDKEDNKETLCRWCVEGGSLICCDFCPKSFCKTCIKRNLGRIKLSEILNQDDSVQWKCFVCEPTPIESLKVTCRKVYNDVRLFVDKQRFKKLTKKPISKLTEIANKKRTLSKAFPNDSSNRCTNVTASKIANHTATPIVGKQKSKGGVLLNNMSNFGSDWYMRNVKLRNIFTEIDDIDPRSLLNAINSTKRCIEAFYSDIRNLEMEISKASTAADIPAIVSMFKSVYRHHIFNRFCQVKTRIDEDKKAKSSQSSTTTNGAGKTSTEFSVSGIKNTNSIPSLLINNVVSTAAPLNDSMNSVTTNTSTTHTAMVANGLNVMTSIDLTDEPDKLDDEPSPTIVISDTLDPISTPIVVKEQLQNKPEEIVDLCADDDTATIDPYPTVNLNGDNRCVNNDSSDANDSGVVVDKSDN